MTITEWPPTAARSDPVSAPPAAVSGTPEPVSSPPDFVSETPEPVSGTPEPVEAAERGGDAGLLIALSAAAAIGGVMVGVIGFAMSYDTLAHVALSWGFSPTLAKCFPIGVDASIVAFLALDLYLILKDTPWPMLRLAAHGMTGATVWFNASSQGSIQAAPVQAAAHGVMPILFVVGVEAARRLFIKKAQIEAGTAADRIPLHRWILSPWETPKFYRRMRLYNVTSYPEMIRRQQELIAYELWLKRKHDGNLDEATEDELLPMTMAPYGYTVAEALAMPEQQEREAEARREEAGRRRLAAETRRKVAEADAEAERLRAEGQVEAVRAEVEGTTGQARAQARAAVTAAERAAQLEEEALETATITEARARTAAAERREAEERLAAAAADEEAGKAARRAAEERRAAAEADRVAAAEASAIETATIAEARRRAAEADREAAQLERRAAEERRAAAEADRVAAAEASAIETATIAEARRRAAEADRRAAETERAAAETRRAAAEAERLRAEEKAREEAAFADVERSKQAAAEAQRAAAERRRAVAEIELRATEMEDAAKLKPRERAVRKVARLILATAGGEAERLPLADIQRELNTSPGTASEYRKEADQLLRGGYRPTSHV